MTTHQITRTFRNISQEDNFRFEDQLFLDCKFVDCVCEGAAISSCFVNCQFKNVDWYWCIGHSPIFVNCNFKRCDLRGGFYGASFVRCTFTDCETGDDNLGGKTEWDDSKASQCTLIRTTLPIQIDDEN